MIRVLNFRFTITLNKGYIVLNTNFLFSVMQRQQYSEFLRIQQFVEKIRNKGRDGILTSSLLWTFFFFFFCSTCYELFVI